MEGAESEEEKHISMTTLSLLRRQTLERDRIKPFVAGNNKLECLDWSLPSGQQVPAAVEQW